MEYTAVVQQEKGDIFKIIPLKSDNGIDYIRARVELAYPKANYISIKIDEGK